MKHTGWKAGLLALALCLMLLTGACAAAEDVDLSALSDAQLTALYDRAAAEIVSRGIRRTATLPKGTYIAGEDLPAGRYVFTCLATGDDWGNVTVYSERGSGKQLLWEVVAAPEDGEEPETFMVTLNEGDALRSGVPFSLTVYTGALFR